MKCRKCGRNITCWNWEGKRLLLGGTCLYIRCCILCKEVGAYVIVTDYLDGGVSKEIADESYTISTSDLDALEQLVISKQIDGILQVAARLI